MYYLHYNQPGSPASYDDGSLYKVIQAVVKYGMISPIPADNSPCEEVLVAGKNRRFDNRASGVCAYGSGYCKNPTVEGETMCAKHREYNRAAVKASRQRQKEKLVRPGKKKL